MCRLNIISHVLGMYSSYLVKLGLVVFAFLKIFLMERDAPLCPTSVSTIR